MTGRSGRITGTEKEDSRMWRGERLYGHVTRKQMTDAQE
jgi:hypothetical protein